MKNKLKELLISYLDTEFAEVHLNITSNKIRIRKYNVTYNETNNFTILNEVGCSHHFISNFMDINIKTIKFSIYSDNYDKLIPPFNEKYNKTNNSKLILVTTKPYIIEFIIYIDEYIDNYLELFNDNLVNTLTNYLEKQFILDDIHSD